MNIETMKIMAQRAFYRALNHGAHGFADWVNADPIRMARLSAYDQDLELAMIEFSKTEQLSEYISALARYRNGVGVMILEMNGVEKIPCESEEFVENHPNNLTA